MHVYNTKGTCARKITFAIEDHKVKSVEFLNGCPGNLVGISQLVVGMEVQEVIRRFDGIPCGSKTTSCPDQLAKALKAWSKDQ